MVFERNINTRRNGEEKKTASRETTNAALTHGARDKEGDGGRAGRGLREYCERIARMPGEDCENAGRGL